MEIGRIIKESWRITRRTPALSALGLISAVQISLYAVIVSLILVPMSLLTQLLVNPSVSGSDSATASRQESFAKATLAVSAWMGAHWSAIVVGIVALTSMWAAFGVFDVAATAGVVSQADPAAERRGASAGAGLRDGFKLWWRTAGLLGIAAIPSLVLMLAGAGFTLFAITLPITAGRLPAASALQLGSASSTGLSTIVGLVNIPLSVLVVVALRFAVLEGLHWKPALGQAWKLCRRHLADVFVAYLVLTGIVLAASLVLGVATMVVMLAGGVGVWALVAGGAAAASPPVLLLAGAAALVLLAGYLLFMVVALVWTSVTWTVLWREMTGHGANGTNDPQPSLER